MSYPHILELDNKKNTANGIRMEISAAQQLIFVISRENALLEKTYQDISGQKANGIVIRYCLVEKLLHALDKKTEFQRNFSPLHWSCYLGQLETTQQLIIHGANVNALTDAYDTPLMLACLSGNKEIVELLLEFNASTSSKNKHGLTAGKIARDKKHIEIAELIAKT